MKNKAIIVVGGASGFGLESIRLMVRDGLTRVGIIDINEQALAKAKEEFSARGVETVVELGDIATRDAAHKAFDAVAARLGRIDALVNCAAVYPRLPLLEITDDAWDLENAINIKGTYHMMVAAVKHMQKHTAPGKIAGRIVNITSVDAFKAHPQNAHYAATKAAVVSLTRSFAHAFAKDQILVNSVAPAGMATEKAKSLGILGELAAANPLGRAAEPAEIAEWVVMLASEKNTYMTGEQVIVSGGYIYA